MDYFFWDKVQQKLYEDRHCKPFPSIQELKEKILKFGDECAVDLQTIRKALKKFLPRLRALSERDGRSIKASIVRLRL